MLIPLEGKRQEAASASTSAYMWRRGRRPGWLTGWCWERATDRSRHTVAWSIWATASSWCRDHRRERANERVVARLGAECGLVPAGGRGRERGAGRPLGLRGGGRWWWWCTHSRRACLPAAAWVGLARTRTTQTAHVDSLACLTARARTTRSLSPIDPRTSRHSRSRLASTTPRAPRHACTDALWAVARGRPGASSLVTQCTQQAASAAPATPCCCCCVHGSCRASGHRSVRSIDREVAAS